MCNDAEVGSSVVEAVAVYVVDDEMGRRVHNLSVHLEVESVPAVWAFDASADIKGVLVPGSVPFVGV